jgi:hypothetical protein
MKDYPKITQEEWDDFLHEYFALKLADPVGHTRLGRMFINYFPDIADDLRENSNLGTPAGVHNPSDDVILYGMMDDREAKAFIMDLVEVIK